MINAKQWDKIDEKYGMLINKICHKISGDYALASFDDNHQDLQIAALEAVEGYEKQHEGANGKFNDFWGSKGFDQYIKTVLWNHKNSKGKNIAKRYNINRDTVSVSENHEVLKIECEKSNSPELSMFLEDMKGMLSIRESKLLSHLLTKPQLIKENGRVNVSRLAESIGETHYETRKLLVCVGERIHNEL
jgi:hypothetical protein